MRILTLLALVACESTAPPPSRPTPTPTPSPAVTPAPRAVNAPKPAANEIDARFVAAIRDAAGPYKQWGRVDEAPNVAPLMCDMPRAHHWGSQGRIHMSDAEDAPHGKKLYYLWASDRAAYKQLAVKTGFTIVKESFAAVPTTDAKRELGDMGDPKLHSKLQVEGKWLTTGEPQGLYVMRKVGDGDGTDAGWIYGTITTAGTVTSAGRVASCIGCHEDAPHDRLFGVKQPGAEAHGY